MTSYADKDEVRRTARFLRRENRSDLAVGSTTFNLSEDARAIRSFDRDGAAQIITVDFTFIPPRKITLTGGGAIVAGEQLLIQYDTQIDDADIDLAIRHAKNDFKDELSHILSDTQLAEFDVETPDQITEITMTLAILYCEQMILKGNKIYGAERDANRMDIMKQQSMMKMFRSGEKQVEGLEIDLTSRFAIGHGGNLVFTDQPTRDKMLDLSLIDDTEEDPAF